MKKSALSNIKSKSFYMLPPLIVMLIMFAVLAKKGIYPFGVNTIDIIDFGQYNAAIYHHLYDALHGTKSLFFDWYTALGTNMSEPLSITSILSPFNLLFFFVKRESILESLSILTLIKMMFMSLSMCIFIRRVFKTNVFWTVLFSVNYAFCGFALLYYSNGQWLDIAAVFPLLILGMIKLLQGKSPVLYCIMLSLCLIINFYASAMILMFLLFVGGLYIAVLHPNKDRGKTVLRLVVSSVLAMALSAPVVLPAYIQMSQSERISKGTENGLAQFLIAIINTFDADAAKWYMLMGFSLAFVIIAKGITAYRKTEKRTTLFIICSILMLSMPLYFENIDLIWHGGSYVMFPVRFGYMITFVFLAAACYYVQKNDALNNLDNDNWTLKSFPKKIFLTVAALGAIFILSLFMMPAINMFSGSIKNNLTMFSFLVLAFLVLAMFYFLSLHRLNRFINYRVVAVVALVVIFSEAYFFIPKNSSLLETGPERNSEYIKTTNELKDKFSIPDSNIERIKNPGNTLNNNFPFILKHSSLSNWTHSVSASLIDNYERIGYSVANVRVLDSGGTVFSDALINVKQTLAVYELDSMTYTLSGEHNEYKLYNNNYQIPFGVTAYDSIVNISSDINDSFDLQNKLFEGLTKEKSLISHASPEYEISGGEITCAIKITGRKALYFKRKTPIKNLTFFTSDGNAVPIPMVSKNLNTVYPANFSSNIIYLGSYTEDTSIKIEHLSDDTIDSPDDCFSFALLDLDKLESYTDELSGYNTNAVAGPSDVKLTVNGTAEKDILLLPISYDEGWKCEINGKKAEILTVAGAFIGVKLSHGENIVKLTFKPKGMSLGILIGIIALIICLCILLVPKITKKKFVLPNIIFSVSEKVFYIVWGGAVFGVYIVPALYMIIMKFLMGL